MFAQEDLRLQRDEAKNEGILIGEQRGVKIGRDEGRQVERKEMVLKMLAAQLPIETVAGISELSIETVREWSYNPYS